MLELPSLALHEQQQQTGRQMISGCTGCFPVSPTELKLITGEGRPAVRARVDSRPSSSSHVPGNVPAVCSGDRTGADAAVGVAITRRESLQQPFGIGEPVEMGQGASVVTLPSITGAARRERRLRPAADCPAGDHSRTLVDFQLDFGVYACLCHSDDRPPDEDSQFNKPEIDRNLPWRWRPKNQAMQRIVCAHALSTVQATRAHNSRVLPTASHCAFWPLERTTYIHAWGERAELCGRWARMRAAPSAYPNFIAHDLDVYRTDTYRVCTVGSMDNGCDGAPQFTFVQNGTVHPPWSISRNTIHHQRLPRMPRWVCTCT
jgi:hypothetical protein